MLLMGDGNKPDVMVVWSDGVSTEPYFGELFDGS